MLATLNKYRAAFSVGLQSNLVYRVNFAIRGFFSFFHLIVVFILWSSAYAGSPLIGGFTFAQTFTYFTALIVVQFMIGAFNEDYQISEEIRIYDEVEKANQTLILIKSVDLRPLEANLFTKAWLESKSR